MPQGLSTNTGLSALPEIDQSKNPDVYFEVLRIRNALKVLQQSLDTYTGILGEDPTFWSVQNPESWIRLQNMVRVYIPASENIAAGAIVNFWNNAGTMNARNAIATTPQYGRAFATQAVTIGNFGEFILMGVTSISGLTPAAIYYLSNTAGLISATPGLNSQILGYALSSTKLFFNPVLQ